MSAAARLVAEWVLEDMPYDGPSDTYEATGASLESLTGRIERLSAVAVRERDEARAALAELEAEVRRLPLALHAAAGLIDIGGDDESTGIEGIGWVRTADYPRIAALLREPAARPDGAPTPDEE